MHASQAVWRTGDVVQNRRVPPSTQRRRLPRAAVRHAETAPLTSAVEGLRELRAEPFLLEPLGHAVRAAQLDARAQEGSCAQTRVVPCAGAVRIIEDMLVVCRRLPPAEARTRPASRARPLASPAWPQQSMPGCASGGSSRRACPSRNRSTRFSGATDGRIGGRTYSTTASVPAGRDLPQLGDRQGDGGADAPLSTGQVSESNTVYRLVRRTTELAL